MNILGIDQSLTSSGITISLRNGEEILFEVIETKKTDDPYHVFRRSKTISDRIMEIVKEHSIDKVVLEGLGFASKGDQTRNLGILQGQIVISLLEAGYEPTIVPPTTLKKFATGKGNAPKEDVFESVGEPYREYIRENYGKTKGRYDLADSYHLAEYGRQMDDF